MKFFSDRFHPPQITPRIPYQRNKEEIRTAREELIQGSSDDYFPRVNADRQDTGSLSSLNSPDLPQDVRYPRQSSESTLDDLGSLGDSSPASSASTPRQYDHLANFVVQEELIEGHELLQTPSGQSTPTASGGHPKPILKQSLTSFLAEKRSSLHDILSTGPDSGTRQARRVSFASRDEFSPSVVPSQSKRSAPPVSELEASTTTEQRLRGITRALFFELERKLKVDTPTPSDPSSSSSVSGREPEPSVDFVQVVPWNDQWDRSGRGPSGSGSLQQIKTQVFSWCNQHAGDSYDGGPRQMVELCALPVELQDLILEFERNRVEHTHGYGKGNRRIVHVDVSRVLNPS